MIISRKLGYQESFHIIDIRYIKPTKDPLTLPRVVHEVPSFYKPKKVLTNDPNTQLLILHLVIKQIEKV